MARTSLAMCFRRWTTTRRSRRAAAPNCRLLLCGSARPQPRLIWPLPRRQLPRKAPGRVSPQAPDFLPRCAAACFGRAAHLCHSYPSKLPPPCRQSARRSGHSKALGNRAVCRVDWLHCFEMKTASTYHLSRCSFRHQPCQTSKKALRHCLTHMESHIWQEQLQEDWRCVSA